MKRIGDFALVAIAVLLLIGLFLFKDYRRYELTAPRAVEKVWTMYILDTRTGEVWTTYGQAGPEREHNEVYYIGKTERRSK